MEKRQLEEIERTLTGNVRELAVKLFTADSVLRERIYGEMDGIVQAMAFFKRCANGKEV